METVLTITVPLPQQYGQRVECLQRKYFGIRLVDEPHITLYLCKFPAKDYAKLLDDFTTYKFEKVPMAISNIKTEKQFYYYEVQSTKLNLLHRKVLKIANPYRAGLIRHKDLQRIKNGQIDGRKKKRLLAYGYTQALSGFNPHVTIGTSNTPIPKALLRMPKIQYTATKLTLSLCKYYEDKDAYVTIKRRDFELL
jgi:2'-5' RNA ligase